MATEFAFLVVKADIRGVFTLQAELTADFVKSCNLLFGKFLRTAEKTGVKEKFRVELDGFHFVIRVEKRIGISERAVVGKKNGVEILQIFGNRVGNFFGRRSAVFRDGNAAERDNRFGHYGLSQRNTRDRERRSVNGVSVNYRF